MDFHHHPRKSPHAPSQSVLPSNTVLAEVTTGSNFVTYQFCLF